jgi:hypothetical protein
VTAVEGAALILERDTLSASDRESLRRVLGSGLDRLRRLGVDDGASGDSHVALFEVASRLAEDPRWSGRVEVDVVGEMVAAGSLAETLEAACQLMTYVSQGTPGRPFVVRGERAGDATVLWIEEAVASRATRRRPPVLDGEIRRSNDPEELALHVASRLVRGQGGELRIANRPGGSRSFGICLRTVEDT